VVVVASIFRDASSYIDRYFEQIARLRDLIPLTLHIAEGDSSDDSWNLLADRVQDTDWLYQINHGGRAFKSVDNPERWNQIATVWNTLLDKLPQDGPLILVEADLIWRPETMTRLLANLEMDEVDACAPQSLQGDRFYDTWGYRWPNGEKFATEPLVPEARLHRISSAGSCIAMKPDVYRDCRFGENDGIVGFWRDAHFKDYELWIDPTVAVEHP